MFQSNGLRLGMMGFALAASTASLADPLAQYTFDDGIGGSTLSASFADPDITASDVVLGDFGLLDVGDFVASRSVAPTGSSLNLASDFLSFTIDGGTSTFSVSELSFQWALDDTPGVNFDVYLLSSATTFSTDKVISTSGSLGTSSTASNPVVLDPFSLDVVVDTSGIVDLQDISGPVEFRIYVTDSVGSGPTHQIDDIAVQGVIPEPSSLALLGLGGVCLLARRRHR